MEGSGGSALKGVPSASAATEGVETAVTVSTRGSANDDGRRTVTRTASQSPGPPLVVKIILMTVWPAVTVLAVRGLLSGIDKVQDINDVKNVDFTPTTCALLAGSASVVQECCRGGSVGTCGRCGGPDERDCYCEQVARAIVCGPGRLVGALGNHWGDDDLQGGSCTHVCKSVYSEDCAEDEDDAIARLTSWVGDGSSATTVPCFVSAAGHVRLAAEAASTRYSGVLFMCVWVVCWSSPYWYYIAKGWRWLKKRLRQPAHAAALVP